MLYYEEHGLVNYGLVNSLVYKRTVRPKLCVWQIEFKVLCSDSQKFY